MLVLMLRWFNEVQYWDGLSLRGIHTKFCKDWFRRWKVDSRHTHTHKNTHTYTVKRFHTPNFIFWNKENRPQRDCYICFWRVDESRENEIYFLPLAPTLELGYRGRSCSVLLQRINFNGEWTLYYDKSIVAISTPLQHVLVTSLL
jgi:hypothetical protein